MNESNEKNNLSSIFDVLFDIVKTSVKLIALILFGIKTVIVTVLELALAIINH